jgi:NitT/TauT family transport system substrate-binding protein
MGRIKPAGKIGIFVLVATVILSVFWVFRKQIAPPGQQAQSVSGLIAEGSSSTPQGDSVAPPNKCLEVGVVTWGGYAGGQYWNAGFKDNPNSKFRADGICVNFHILDDFTASRQAFRTGKMDLMWTTIDALPTESGNFGETVKFVCQVDWSRGGDAIVVMPGIKSVGDLAGKKIAVAEATPSETFLLWMLDMAGLSIMDVNLIKQDSAVNAAAAFKSKQVDAAVVWSPDDDGCIQAVAGSSVLISTKKAGNIIADGFFVKQSVFDRRKDEIRKLFIGWLKGSAEINSNPSAKTEAAKILAANFTGVSLEFAVKAIDNVRLTTYGDNLDFFGLTPGYKGVTGKDIYTKMSTVYGRLNLAKDPEPWDQLVDLDFVKSLGMVTEATSSEKTVTFLAPTAQTVQAKAIASKPVRVSFASGSSTLDENAKGIIDMMFVDQAKAFPTLHFRIEGNTDSTGSAEVNKRISAERAQSVVNYLVSQHGFNWNRFVSKGNGPNNPLCQEDSDSCRSKNRRTDFQILEN